MSVETKKEVKLLDLQAQYREIQSEVETAVIQVLRSGHYVLGPNVQSFETESADFLKTKHAIGCANGSDALYIALLALDIKPGDEVITTPFTYIATAEAITQAGAIPVFADINLDTFNIDPQEIEKKISPKTKAIIVVHLFGQACEMDEIISIAQQHKLKVIEDTAQGWGTTYKNDIYAGTIGDIGTYSFYPTKNLSCAGDGGMISTNSDELNDRIRKIRAHGSKQRYYHDELGVNSRLDEIQAAILRIKLKHINSWNSRRAELAQIYNKELNNLENDNFKIITPKTISNSNHIYHQYSIRIEDKNKSDSSELRNSIKAKLQSYGIGSEVYYPLAIHMQNIYKALGHKAEDFPQALKATQTVLSLPVHPNLNEADIEEVISVITKLQ
jgi:dTDP-4-amino-4,6-dideoxygalactose transaminase